MTTFIETPRFPEDIRFGVSGGAEYNTTVIINGSGSEQRNRNWSQSRGRWTLDYGPHSKAYTDILVAFFRAAGGREKGFRFKDWADYQATSGQGIVTLISGNDYQMYRRYTTGSITEDRKITKPVSGSITVSGGGTYTINTATGVITRTAGAAPTGWTGDYDVPVRFDTDQLKLSIVDRGLYMWSQIELIEVRV